MRAASYFHFADTLKLLVAADLAYQTEHFVSNADIGRDLDGDGRVNRPEEFNPTYIPALDGLGRRIRIEEMTIFTLSVQTIMQF